MIGSESMLVKNTRDGIRLEVHPDIVEGIGGGGSSSDSNHAGEGTYSIALGYDTIATGRNGIAVGRGNHVIGDDSSAFGTGSTVNALNSIVLGNGVECTENNQIVIGGIDQNNIIISGSLSVPSIGGSSEGGLPISTVDGKPLLIQPMNYQPKVVIGGNYYGNAGNAPSTNESLKVYGRTTLEGNLNIGSSGSDKKLYLNGNEITGDNGHPGGGEYSICLGSDSTVTGEGSVAVGNNNTVSGGYSFAVGDGNIVNKDRSFALGNNNVVDGENSIAIGFGIAENNGLGDNAIHLGGQVHTVIIKGKATIGINDEENLTVIGKTTIGDDSIDGSLEVLGEARIGRDGTETTNLRVYGKSEIPGYRKIVNPTSTAQDTGETCFGKTVYIKLWEGYADGLVEVQNFFPTNDSKFVLVGGYDTTSVPIPFYGASNYKCLITKGGTSLMVDLAATSSGAPREVKAWVKYADD
ncbi:hypothetical protein FACS189472_08760 [Alphaproteobacteria bacterium]|nr:hypothetical protein FACS189472_08760 [Alphaproteobacteria bacterium]